MNGDEAFVVQLVYVTMSVLSFLGSTVIITSFLALKQLRTFNNLLVFWLSVADAGAAASNFLTFSNMNHTVCVVQAFTMQFFDLSSFLWTAAIAVHAVLSTTKGVEKKSPRWLIISYIGVCFGVPGVIAMVSMPHVLGIFGQSDPTGQTWCWIQSEAQLYRFLFYYGPLVVIWFFNACSYVFVLQRLRKYFRFVLFPKKQTSLHLRLYLLVFVITKVPGLINRTVTAISGDELVLLYIVQAASDPLQGFFNAIIYGMNRHRRRVLRHFFRRYCCCCGCGRAGEAALTYILDSDESESDENDGFGVVTQEWEGHRYT